MKDFKGIIAAMVTPFNEDHSINKESTQNLVNILIEKGVHGIFVISGAGEFSSLYFEEKKELLEIVVDEVNGKIPVYAGTGAVTTAEAIKLTEYAEKIGADAVSVIAPYSINPNQDELYDYFSEIAKSTNLPVVLYNHPKKAGVNMSLELVKNLSKINNIVGIKDSSGDLTMTMGYINLQNDKFSVFTGIDTLIYASLACGARGSISSTAGVVPEFAVKIYESTIKKNFQAALKAQNDLVPFRNAFSLGTFPAVLKEALNMSGLSVGLPRKPIKPLTEENKKKLRVILKNMNK